MKDNSDLYSLRYPIGEFESPEEVTKYDIEHWINEIELFPEKLRNTVEKLTEAQLSTPYRPGGWKVSQLVHHLCDSHLNGYIRFKLALTEDRPTIKPYDQARWAELPDYQQFPVTDSLNFLELMHHRWVSLLKSMHPQDFERLLNHPESGVHSLKRYLGLYAWHGNHHLAHITGSLQRSP